MFTLQCAGAYNAGIFETSRLAAEDTMPTETLEKFFTGKEFVIPGYQRDYAWKKQQSVCIRLKTY